MKGKSHRQRAILVIGLAVGVLVGGLAACAGRDAHKSQASEVDKVSRRFEAELEKQDFEVNEGYFKLWGIEECPES